ncbi:MAG: hypothetical protein KIT22_09875 [Verrucomicrobiae bacterium]|nr:hypothetical protein [Verrucomicrobiae bacterium]
MSTATQGIDVVIKATTQQAGAAFALLQGFVQGVGMAVANLAGRAARALGEMTREAISTADAMGKAAEKAGTTAERFSAVAGAAKLSGVSLDTFQNGLRGLSQWMERNGQAGRDVIDVFLEQADAFSGMADGAGKTTQAMERFGRAGLNLIPMLNRGSEAIHDQMEEARRLGVVVSNETAESAGILNDRIDLMKTRFEGVFMQLAKNLLPHLLKLSDTLLASVDEGGPFLDFLTEAGNLMSMAADASGWLGQKWAMATTAMGSFVGSLAAGMSVQEAWAEAARDSAEAQEQFREKVEKYRIARQKASGGNRGESAEVAKLASQYEMLGFQIAALDNKIAHAQAGDGEGERNTLLRERLELLEKQRLAIGVVWETKDTDGNTIYTEEGLKNAEKFLEISRQINETEMALNGPSFGDQMQANVDGLGNSMQRLANFTTSFVTGAMQGLSSALTDVIMGTKRAGEAFAAFGLSLLTNFIASVIEMVLIAKVAIPVLTALGVLSGGVTAGAGLAMVMASLAAGASAASGAIGGFASGGSVSGPGSWYSDSILARLSNDEYVVSAPAAMSVGHDTLDQINSTGQLPGQDNQPIYLGLFGLEAAARQWLDSVEGRKYLANVIREEVGRYA